MSKYDECEASNTTIPIDLVANFPESILLNGMTNIPCTNTLLVADAKKGVIWRLNVDTKEVGVAIDDTASMLNATAALNGGLAANGVYYQNGYAYITNTGFDLFSRVPVDENGVATGDAETLVQGPLAPDDFALTGHGKSAFFADQKLDAVQFTDGSGHVKPVVAVGSPTSVQLRRLEQDKNAIFIGISGNRTAFGEMPIPSGGSISRFEIQYKDL